MDFEELILKNRLATGDDYAEIRKRAINFIVKSSTSALSPELIRGMLMLVKHIDEWTDEYEAALKKRKEQQ